MVRASASANETRHERIKTRRRNTERSTEPKRRVGRRAGMHTAFALLFALQATPACGWSSTASYSVSRTSTARMGLFDQIAKAFQNEEFKEDDQRLAHLAKGDDDLDRIVGKMGELSQQVEKEPDRLGAIFAEIARRALRERRVATLACSGASGPARWCPSSMPCSSRRQTRRRPARCSGQ